MAGPVDTVLLNLLSSALWELAFPRDRVSPAQPRGSRAIAQAVNELSSRLADTLDPSALSVVVDLLGAPEIQAIVRALYLHRADDKGMAPRAARNAFRALCRSQPSLHAVVDADTLFNSLVDACDLVLEKAIDDGSLLALDTRAALRHKLLAEQLEALDRLAGPHSFSNSDLFQFMSDLRREMANRTAYIIPPDFYGAPRIAISRLYVDPEISHQKDSTNSLPLRNWIPAIRSSVILGNPGAGKSSLVTRVCHLLATAKQPVLGTQVRVPFILKLRDYSTAKRQRPLAIAEFIAEEIHSSLQMPFAPAIVEQLLLTGRLFVAFDGLDELLEPKHRQAIRDEIESFARRYPNAYLLVTSREVGYPLSPLDQERFTITWLRDFTQPQIEEYAYNWFALDEELSPAKRNQKAASFLQESVIVRDLRSNPLMLALMCNIYRGMGYIPRNRPDVYERCATMLFEIWDKRRAIKVYLPISAYVEPAMNDLARWIYEDEGRQGGVTESALIGRTAEFLHERQFADLRKATSAAKAFVSFCSGRAWVFTDTGTTDTGEPIFQFTHRTFLEYFTARQLVTAHESVAALADEIIPRVAAGEWEVVSQLAFQIKARNVDGGADTLFSRALKQMKDADDDDFASAIAGFLSRCMAFMFPKPAVVAAVVDGIVDRLLASPPSSDRWLDALAFAMLGSAENRDAVRAGVEKALAKHIERKEGAAIELLLGLHAVAPLSRATVASRGGMLYWANVRTRLLSVWATEVERAIAGSAALDAVACGTGYGSMVEYLERNGLGSLVTPQTCKIWRNRRIDIHASLLRATLGGARRKITALDIALLAKAMLATKTPWLTSGQARSVRTGGVDGLELRRASYRADQADECFVGFCLLAVLVELRRANRGPTRKASLPRVSGPLAEMLSEEGLGRDVELEKLEQILSDDQFAFVEGWVRGGFHLIERNPVPKRR